MKFNWEIFKEEMRINDIDTSLFTQTELFITYVELYNDIINKKAKARWNMEQVEAVVKNNIRNEITDDKGKVLSDAKINALVIQNPEYITAKEAYMKTEADETLMRFVMDAIAIRKDMLRSLSANRREESSLRGYGVPATDEVNTMKNALFSIQQQLGIAPSASIEATDTVR